ncbi:hypothetical protein [Aquisphaera insulae]|uniref:hypothetical protein n=1 Tax=Aquisphaera insulae TaxID=2712864 RepID=UPI0013EDEBE0|nr:hypothetical protein [Aquisphaera insulae]
MIGNPPSPSPTPSPDGLTSPDEASLSRVPVPTPHTPARRPAPEDGSSSASGDEFYALLEESSPDPFLRSGSGEGETPREGRDPGPAVEFIDEQPDGPEPAPFLGPLSSSDNAIELPVVFTPPPDTLPAPAASEAVRPTEAATTNGEEDASPRVHWRWLLLASYASAVTLALAWILWTGRGLHRPSPEPSDTEAVATDPSEPGHGLIARPSPPLPRGNLVGVSSKARLGGLDVHPTGISFGNSRLERLHGVAGEARDVSNVLILSLRLKNRSSDQSFVPLETSFVRDSGHADDGTYIETANGRRVPMYHLAVESEWSFPDQHFDELKPGEQADTVLVSQPVRLADLAGPFTWHVKLRTEPYRKEVLGIRFRASEIKR